MFSHKTKSLITNVIRHTDTHNRILEQDEMWRQHGKPQKNSPDLGRRAHMDRRDHESRQPDDGQYRDSSSTHWQRKLQNLEEQEPGRWGHGGYKELYPEEFRSSRSVSPARLPVKHKKKKHKSSEKSKKKKSKKKKRKKSSKHYSSNSESEKEESTYKRKREEFVRSPVLSSEQNVNTKSKWMTQTETDRTSRKERNGTENSNAKQGTAFRNSGVGNMLSRALRAVAEEQTRNPAPLRPDTPPDRSPDRHRRDHRTRDGSDHRKDRSRDRYRDRSRSPREGKRRPSDHRNESYSRHSNSSRRRSRSRSREKAIPDKESKTQSDRNWRKRRYNSSSSDSSSSSGSSPETKNRKKRTESSSSSNSD